MHQESLVSGIHGEWASIFQSAFDSCPFGIHFYLREEPDRLIFANANEAADTILGTDNKQFIGKTLEDAFPSLMQTEVPDHYRQVLATGKPWHTDHVEYQHGQISGAYEVHAYRSGPDSLLVLFADVTERKRGELARAQSARYLKALNDATQLLLSDLDADLYCGFAEIVGNVAEAKRVALYVFSRDETEDPPLEARVVWLAENAQIAEFTSKVTDPDSRILRSWLDDLVQGETQADRISKLNPDRAALLAETGEGHFVMLPLDFRGDSLGALILERSQHDPPWDALEVGFLRIAAADLARALDRAKNQRILQNSEERFRSIVNEMTDIIWVVDKDVRIRYATPSCRRVLGYDPESMIGKSGLDLVHSDDIPKVTRDFQQVADRANPFTPTEFRFKHAQGHWVHLEATGINLIDRPGVDGILLTTRDITQRKKTEELVRLTQFVVESISDSVFLYQRSGTFFYVNHAACQSLGYSPEELTHMSVPDIDPSYPEQRREILFRDLRRMGAIRFESAHQRKDGSLYPVEVSLNVITFEGEEYVCAIARDITARKQAECELQRSEERFRSLIENASDVVATIKVDGTIEYVSPSVERVVGFDSEESLGTNVLDYVHPDDIRMAQAGIARVFAGAKIPNKLECRIRHRDGSLRHVDITGTQFLNAQGETRAVITYRDVTDRIVAEEERRKLEAQLRQSQKLEAVGQLAGGVAHDFNNLLTAIRGYTELAIDDLPYGHPVIPLLQESVQASARAESLVRQLLLFSRRGEPQLQTVNLDEVVAGTGQMLGRLIGEHIDLRIAPPRESLTVRVDPGQIEQILINLCVNARDALPGGGVIHVVTYGTALDDAFCRENSWANEGNFAILEVSDSGEGIPPEHMERIFDPFFTTKGIGQGTGLGLATVYGITKNHNGFIHVESEIGAGTSFRIYIPRTTLEAECETADEKPSIPPASGQTILLAEDDPQVRALTIRILEQGGYRVIPAETGERAMAEFHRHADRIDACVIDVVMPKLSGRQVREQIRAVRPTIPILHITGYDFNILDREIAPEEGVPLLMKPFTSAELLIKLKNLLT
jgi:PAS domain S-box-containing protein